MQSKIHTHYALEAQNQEYSFLAGPISERLFKAIWMVESSGSANPPDGDNGAAIGPFQIHEVYWEDAAEYDPSLKADGHTYKNCKGDGAVYYSERVMQVNFLPCYIPHPIHTVYWGGVLKCPTKLAFHWCMCAKLITN